MNCGVTDMERITNHRHSAQKGRSSILVGGFLLSLVGGMSYAWGSFTIPLVEDWGWSIYEATLPLTVLIVVFALMMIPAGWLQDKFGPKKIALAGSVLFLIGYSLAALILQMNRTHVGLIITYGFIVGSACGLSYACIAPTARKWFPDRPGFAVSIAVMGFGLAAVVFAPLKKVMILQWGVDGTLLVLGFFIFVLSIMGASLLRNPPPDWVPPLSAGKNSTNHTQTILPIPDVPPHIFIRQPVFYFLWIALAAVIGGGLTAIGLLNAYGEIKLNLPPTQAALAISVFSLVNGLGRPLAGWFADRIGAIRVMTVMYFIQCIAFLTLPWAAVNLPLLLIYSVLLGAGYAVTFALFPVVVAQKFGTKYLGLNYGLVFSAFALGALTGLIGSKLLDITGSFVPAFILAGLSTFIGLVILLFLHKKLEQDRALPVH